MQINWFGHACFKIQDKIGGENVAVLTDPFGKALGLKPPKIDADIITISSSHPDHSSLEGMKQNPFLIKNAGEYDIKGVLIEGIEAYHEQKKPDKYGNNIIYRIEMNFISLVHLGGLAQELDEKQMEKIASPDILLIPVGGGRIIGPKTAVELVSRIEPRIVIPMQYKIEGSSAELESVDRFVKEIGLKPRQEEKLKISKKDLPQGETELVILQI